MATKKFILNIEEGLSLCKQCPLLECKHFKSVAKCSSYDWATARLQDMPTQEMVSEFAIDVAHEIWTEQMQHFATIPNYYIGANDISDLIKNAMLDMYNFMIGKQPQQSAKPSADAEYPDKIVPAKNTTNQ